jgi:5-oxoprolinase (ATP-hydrolysing) subunit C
MTADRATLTLLSPGLHTLVVDAGRPRSRSLGVPVGGAADRFALAIGNALVGNPPDTAALEVSLAGPTLQADAPLACVLYGAPFVMRSDRQELAAGTTFTLQTGERLHISGTARGMRAYVCIRGGIDARVILGSRSSLKPLEEGAQLTCRSGTIRRRRIHPAPFASLYIPRLSVLACEQSEWFPPEALTQARRFFEVTGASNRMGLRLKGEPLPLPAREMVSEPVCPGTVQVTRDGQCIILGVDGQTIGGYPKVAQVVWAELDKLGQLRPGERITFEYVSLERAEELHWQRAELLREWLARLQVTSESS